MSKTPDGKPTVVVSKPAREPDTTRRDMALTLMGLFGASAFLEGCAAPAEGADEVEENLAVAALPLTGKLKDILYFQTYDELRTWTGGFNPADFKVAIGIDRLIGGLFVWTTDTTTLDNGATDIVPTNGPRTGCWKRSYSGPLDVHWFGAKGNGITPDHEAIQAAINYALIAGHDVYFPAGYYIVQNTINIGESIYSNLGFIFNRSQPLGDGGIKLNWKPDWQDIVARNREKHPISLTFAQGAFIVADLPAGPVFTPKAVIAYNLDNFRGTGIVSNIKVISVSSFVGGKVNLHTATLGGNLLIGFFASVGCGVVDKALFVGLHCGMATVISYWTTIRDLTAYTCYYGLNIVQGNAMTVSNITFDRCFLGLVFDGSGTKITMINSEQVKFDIVIFGADCCTFGPGYLEDTENTEGAFITTGNMSDENAFTTCVFDTVRVGGSLNGGKKGLTMVYAKNTTFINVRLYSSPIEELHPLQSYGALINCDFALTPSQWNVV